MAKTRISEFDIDPANNTDINSINIAEGCAPSGINNAIRQLMSDLKEFQTGAGGDSITAVGLYSDTIGEKTSAAGVTVDGVLIKDNAVTASGGFSGALNGAVGGTTPAAGAFTTLSASSTLTVTGAGSIQGLTVGRGAGAVSTNTAVGASALQATNTGGYNTAIGYQSSTSSTSAARNTSVGWGSLRDTTSGSDLSAFGFAALVQNTTGSYNTAQGTQALYSNTTASNNTAVGYQSLYSNTTSTYNTALGYQSLYNSTGQYNTAVGGLSMFLNTTGVENAAVGVEALRSNTTGSYNTAIGRYALFGNTTASNNTAVGYQAGYSNTTGASNAFFGHQAGYSNAGTYNTFIGYQAGFSVNTYGGNTFIGRSAGYSVTTGFNNTILGCYNGNQGGLDIRTASNYIVLSDGDGNPSLYGTGTGAWNLGTGGTSSANTGWLNINGSSATNYGPFLRYSNNGTFLADAGDYAVIVGSSTHQYAIRCGGSGGVYLAATATSWSAVSDETQKNIIEPITDGLNKVASLRSVIGSYKADETNTRHPFLIAQDVKAVLPEAVSENEHDGETVLGVAYTDVIPLLVAAIKELKAEIDLLKGVK